MKNQGDWVNINEQYARFRVTRYGRVGSTRLLTFDTYEKAMELVWRIKGGRHIEGEKRGIPGNWESIFFVSSFD